MDPATVNVRNPAKNVNYSTINVRDSPPNVPHSTDSVAHPVYAVS